MNAIAPASDFAKISRAQYGILFRIADSKKSGSVSLQDFVAFEGLLKKPDAEFDVSNISIRSSVVCGDYAEYHGWSWWSE